MRKILLRREWIGFFFVSFWGVVGHFIYEWSGKSMLLAAVFSVNESTWEHMKLLYFPLFLFTMVEYISLGEPLRNYFASKFAAALAGLAAIPLLFYTLNGAFGKTPDWINIAIYFLAAALSALIAYKLLCSMRLRTKILQPVAFALFWALLLLFVYFTYRPPLLPLFCDPRTGTYGIPQL